MKAVRSEKVSGSAFGATATILSLVGFASYSPAIQFTGCHRRKLLG
jgi:hypothetical protein